MRKKWILSFILCFMIAFFPVLSVNATTNSVVVQLEVENQLTGDKTSKDESFTFVLKPINDAPMPENDSIVIMGAGKSSFSPITFTEPETYYYTLYEVSGNKEGYIYDDTIYDVTAQVTTNDMNKLAVSVYVSKQGSSLKKERIIFENHYELNGREEAMYGNVSQNSKNPNSSPMTGETVNFVLWVTLCVVSFFVLIIILILSIRKQYHKNCI